MSWASALPGQTLRTAGVDARHQIGLQLIPVLAAGYGERDEGIDAAR